MNSEQFLAIEKAIHIIDTEIRKTLDLDKLAKEVGISKYYLHRLFKSITGKSVMSYARDRKLSTSITDLVNTNLNIIDIANEYQFNYEQSYIRAFKKKYNITPSEYRKVKSEIPIEQKIDTNYLRMADQGLIVKPRMCIKPQFYVQGIKKEIIHAENLINDTANKFAREFQKSYMRLMDNVIDENTYIGLVLYTEHAEYSNEYVSCTEVTSITHKPPPFADYTIPTREYAVFRYIGFHSPYEITFATLKELYNFIYQWKENTVYRQSEPFHFEKMNLRTCSKSYCEMDIYVPISAKNTTPGKP